MKKHLRVSIEEVGKRLDQFLAELSEIGSRSQAQKWIDEGAVLVNGQKVSKSYRLRVNDELIIGTKEYRFETGQERVIIPVDRPLPILYEDSYLLVINKPSGLVTHPSLGHWEDSVVHRLMGRTPLSQGSEPSRPGIVHRLDRETSGLMVVAKDNETHRFLAFQFQKKPPFVGIRRW